MKNNPLKDKKLHKFIQQNQSIKAIMDHISKFGTVQQVDQLTDKVAKISTKESSSVITSQITINKFNETFKVIYDDSVKSNRKFILCCIIDNISLTPATFKEFISFQTKLHDGLCDQRRLATIATHDYNLLPSQVIRYVSKSKDEILLQPLGRHKQISVDEYMKSLLDEAEALRKEKKRSVYSGVYKYLNHFPNIFEQREFAILQAETGATLSFPPLTNSELTKMSLNTKKMLIEVTSNTSAKDCDAVMTALIRKALELSFSSQRDEIKKVEIEQVRIQDKDGNLKTIYPSKVDLKSLEEAAVEIVRNN